MKKNNIQQQADDFMLYVIRTCSNHRSFIDHCSKAMLNYKKNIHTIVFLERLLELMKANEERHRQFCTSSEEECRFTRFYKVVMFYLKNELDYQERNLPFAYFKKDERRLLDHNIEELLSQLPAMSINSQGNFMKLKLELNEMKTYYFLDKKNWKQLFWGKVMVLENSRIITHEQSTNLLEKIEERFLLPG